MTRQAFRVGARLGLVALVGDTPAWAPVIAELPGNPPTCPSGDVVCHESIVAAVRAGRLATLLYWQCRAGISPDDGLNGAHDRLAAILASGDLMIDTSQGDPIRALEPALSCNTAMMLLDEMFSDWRGR